MTPLKFISIISFFLLLLGCQNKQPIENFTYKFTMESINNYKVEFQLDPDTNYIISQTNQFFDKFDGVYRPVNKTGTLTTSEFDNLRKLIQESNIEEMKDAYGFNNDENSDNTVIYNIELSHNNQQKFVIINLNSQHKFSKSFLHLIEYTNELIANKTELE